MEICKPAVAGALESSDAMKFAGTRRHEMYLHSVIHYGTIKTIFVSFLVYGTASARTRPVELPQLWIVLKGDMNYGGLRPERAYFLT